MKLYIDLLFLLNLSFDFILLLATSIILKRNTKITRILLGALVGACSIFILFLRISTLMLFFIKLIIAFLMVIVTFKFKDLRYTIRNITFLYTLSIILGGFLYLLNIEFSYKNSGIVFYHNGLSINWIVLLIISPIIIYLYVKQAIMLKNNYSNYYKVDIYFKDNKKLQLNAFLDTGNHLTDPYKNRPIILVHSKEIYKYINEKNMLLVPYTSLNNKNLLKCIKAEKIEIKGVGCNNKFLIGISEEKIKIDGVDCILSLKLLEGCYDK